MNIEKRAVDFLVGVLRTASDSQQGEHALANHDEFGPWLEACDDPIGESQRLIRLAEAKLGDAVPY